MGTSIYGNPHIVTPKKRIGKSRKSQWWINEQLKRTTFRFCWDDKKWCRTAATIPELVEDDGSLRTIEMMGIQWGNSLAVTAKQIWWFGILNVLFMGFWTWLDENVTFTFDDSIIFPLKFGFPIVMLSHDCSIHRYTLWPTSSGCVGTSVKIWDDFGGAWLGAQFWHIAMFSWRSWKAWYFHVTKKSILRGNSSQRPLLAISLCAWNHPIL